MKLTQGFVRGTVVMSRLADVQPNVWNPNRMTKHQMESLVHGLRTDGWLASQALLIWGKDDLGKVRNIIIDGEHRYQAALTTGIAEGPMVFLEGLTEHQAKALTIKMNQKRGNFDEVALEELMKDIVGADSFDTVDLDFGFDPKSISAMFGESMDSLVGVDPPPPSPPKLQGDVGVQPNLRVPLVFFVPNTELEWFKKPFAHPTRETELVTDVLRAMITKHNNG